jgi:YgiT-type zinc finger domain-containing protein
MSNKRRQYGRCECCGGPVVERRLTVDRRFRGKLHEFENVPVGACQDCGQRVYKGKVLERMESLSRDKAIVKKTIRVPVAEFGPVGA